MPTIDQVLKTMHIVSPPNRHTRWTAWCDFGSSTAHAVHATTKRGLRPAVRRVHTDIATVRRIQGTV